MGPLRILVDSTLVDKISHRISRKITIPEPRLSDTLPNIRPVSPGDVHNCPCPLSRYLTVGDEGLSLIMSEISSTSLVDGTPVNKGKKNPYLVYIPLLDSTSEWKGIHGCQLTTKPWSTSQKQGVGLNFICKNDIQ